MRKIIYQYKQPLGPFNTLYLHDVESNTKSKVRKGRFICSFCGNEFDAMINNIKKGSQKSCGCLAKKAKSENGKRNMKDLTNQRFGSLVALEPTKQRNRGQVVWKCKCDCGNIHYAPSAELIRGKVKSCGCVHSFGEQKIHALLEELSINFKTQYQFDKCRNPKTNCKLYFDFYLPDYNCCIEYDGIQHFKKYANPWDDLSDVQFRDNVKNIFCQQNNIRLIRISYKEKDMLSKEYLLQLLGEKICPSD